LIACAAGIGVKTYWVWKEGPWELPNPVNVKTASAALPPQTVAKAVLPPMGVEAIVAKNIFDPERGASRTKEAEADTRATQRIRNMVLLGTAILGPNKYAIVQDSAGSPVGSLPGQPSAQAPRRLRVGDTVEGFSLAEINDKGVVFVKGTTRVDLAVDYFRKVDTGRATPLPGTPAPQIPAMPGPVQPGQAATSPAPATSAVPNISRRPRLAVPPSP
jgi:hypothetical protein